MSVSFTAVFGVTDACVYCITSCIRNNEYKQISESGLYPTASYECIGISLAET